MFSHDDRLLLSQTTPRTGMGEFLRRYWHPVGAAADLTDADPIREIRVLSQDIVLFRDKRGRVGCLPALCPHAQGELKRGYVEDEGLVCWVHGWLFDVEGNAYTGWYYRDQSSEWAKTRAYPVVERAGLHWVYLGPDPAPAFPSFSTLDAPRGQLRITIYPVQSGNWLVEHSNGLWAWRWHVARGGRLPTSEGATFAAHDGRLVRTPDGATLVLPSHLQTPDCLWLRTPTDQNNTWQATIEVLPDTDPTAAPEIIRFHPRAAPPQPDQPTRRYSFYSVWGDTVPFEALTANDPEPPSEGTLAPGLALLRDALRDQIPATV